MQFKKTLRQAQGERQREDWDEYLIPFMLSLSKHVLSPAEEYKQITFW